MESLKLPTTPGDSPGVGCLKQGLLALQRIPWSHGSVPADGIALLGKWPVDRNNKTGSESRFTTEVCYQSKSIITTEAGADLISEEFSLVLSQTQINNWSLFNVSAHIRLLINNISCLFTQSYLMVLCLMFCFYKIFFSTEDERCCTLFRHFESLQHVLRTHVLTQQLPSEFNWRLWGCLFFIFLLRWNLLSIHSPGHTASR